MLCQLDGELPNGLGARFKREMCFLVAGLLVAALALVTFIEPTGLKLFIAGGFFIVGLALGIFLWRSTADAHWPVVARCIDRSRIEARLRELDA